MMFAINELYTRKSIWKLLYPGEVYPSGGNWSTGYSEEKGTLFVFANIGSPGRTGYDFPNSYNPETGHMEWYGKSSAHSGQRTFERVLKGELSMNVFVRWDNNDPKFVYLGQPDISSWEDGVTLSNGNWTIKLNLVFNGELTAVNPKTTETDEECYDPRTEGRLIEQVSKRYERDPKLRLSALKYHGMSCAACGFNFKKAYGEFGDGFIHVHHLSPLGSVGSEHQVDPVKDLIPLCPNCHAMIHRSRPPLSLVALKRLIADQA